MGADSTARAAEKAARLSYGKLVALLAARTGDIAGAQDALSDALLRALERWSRDGVPTNPEGWLLTVARRAQIDRWRSASNRDAFAAEMKLISDRQETAPDHAFPDERLKLLFVCAHPAIEVRARTPLMLQAVLGLDARRIASAFLVAPGTMGQRMTRARAKIRDSGIKFEEPPPDGLSERVESVLDAIYAAYTFGWDGAFTEDAKARGLAREAIWLGRLVAELMPGEPEALGLLALMLFSEARAGARRDPVSGAYIPLPAQDTTRWSEPMMREAESLLRRAGRCNLPGRYQLEAAIQAVHAHRRVTGATDWQAIALLYRELAGASGTVGALVGHVAALCESGAVEVARAALDTIPAAAVAAYQPYWATRAHIMARLSDAGAARVAYERAAGLTEDAAVRAWLLERCAGLPDR